MITLKNVLEYANRVKAYRVFIVYGRSKVEVSWRKIAGTSAKRFFQNLMRESFEY